MFPQDDENKKKQWDVSDKLVDEESVPSLPIPMAPWNSHGIGPRPAHPGEVVIPKNRSTGTSTREVDIWKRTKDKNIGGFPAKKNQNRSIEIIETYVFLHIASLPGGVPAVDSEWRWRQRHLLSLSERLWDLEIPSLHHAAPNCHGKSWE